MSDKDQETQLFRKLNGKAVRCLFIDYAVVSDDSDNKNYAHPHLAMWAAKMTSAFAAWSNEKFDDR